jgi:hypothetical protein
MRDRNNQHNLGFEKVDNAQRKASKDYPAGTYKVGTAMLREGRNTDHRSLDCRDEVVT